MIRLDEGGRRLLRGRQSMQPTLRRTCCSGRGVTSGSVPLVGTAFRPGGRVGPCVFLPTQFTVPLLSDRKKSDHLNGELPAGEILAEQVTWNDRSCLSLSSYQQTFFFPQCFKLDFRFPSECYILGI